VEAVVMRKYYCRILARRWIEKAFDPALRTLQHQNARCIGAQDG
jgi:hypothetical protein